MNDWRSKSRRGSSLVGEEIRDDVIIFDEKTKTSETIKKTIFFLDMVHADLWSKLQQMHQSKNKSLIVKEVELSCLIILIEEAMKEIKKGK
jgi:hypothetical protein